MACVVVSLYRIVVMICSVVLPEETVGTSGLDLVVEF
jgi:hypothetical protein